MGRGETGRHSEHIPVLLDEVLKNLVQSTSGTYLDATFGRGGHCRALLEMLDADARVIALDRDPQAVAAGAALCSRDKRVTVHHARFSQMADVVAAVGAQRPEGILMDLGVSSPQLDEGERGFSFRHEGPLDMRMDPEQGESAADWLNRAEEADIARVLRDYGEERHARRIARAVIAARPLQTTLALAEVVAAAVPMRGQPARHPATRTFQAIRIHINDEMHELEEGMNVAFELLSPGGRLAVISFHSLEDRQVKQYFRTLTRPPSLPRRVPVRHNELHTRARDVVGPLRADVRELNANPRARSATLRVIEKNADGDGGRR